MSGSSSSDEDACLMDVVERKVRGRLGDDERIRAAASLRDSMIVRYDQDWMVAEDW